MGLFAIIVFALSLLGIIILFALKAWEERHATIVAPSARQRADQRALELKAQLMQARRQASHIWPFIILFCRYLIHEGALSFARAAHLAGAQANRLADLVSHKHRFERQAPRSEFLKQVAERPTAYEYPSAPIRSSVPTSTLAQGMTPRRTTPMYRKKKTGLEIGHKNT